MFVLIASSGDILGPCYSSRILILLTYPVFNEQNKEILSCCFYWRFVRLRRRELESHFSHQIKTRHWTVLFINCFDETQLPRDPTNFNVQFISFRDQTWLIYFQRQYPKCSNPSPTQSITLSSIYLSTNKPNWATRISCEFQAYHLSPSWGEAVKKSRNATEH